MSDERRGIKIGDEFYDEMLLRVESCDDQGNARSLTLIGLDEKVDVTETPCFIRAFIRTDLRYRMVDGKVKFTDAEEK